MGSATTAASSRPDLGLTTIVPSSTVPSARVAAPAHVGPGREHPVAAFSPARGRPAVPSQGRDSAGGSVERGPARRRARRIRREGCEVHTGRPVQGVLPVELEARAVDCGRR